MYNPSANAAIAQQRRNHLQAEAARVRQIRSARMARRVTASTVAAARPRRTLLLRRRTATRTAHA